MGIADFEGDFSFATKAQGHQDSKRFFQEHFELLSALATSRRDLLQDSTNCLYMDELTPGIFFATKSQGHQGSQRFLQEHFEPLSPLATSWRDLLQDT